MMRKVLKTIIIVLVGLTMSVSCSDNIDESNLYTFTGQTIRDYLNDNDSIFHQFNIILQRSGYDRKLGTYGQYTCYAPVNEGVDRYIDSLYNDTLNKKTPRNGLTENSVYGLPDELCKEIASYHLSAMENLYIEKLNNAGGVEISTMMNTPFISKVGDDGVVRFNNVAKVLEYDKEMTNGYVHVISDVIPRTTRRIAEVLEQRPEFKLFFEGLEKTGLIDSLYADKKLNPDGTVKKYHLDNNKGRPGSDFQHIMYYVPEECKIKYTIFAESDKVLAEEGITDFASLKAKCVEWYADAARWYQYPDMENNPISTGDDYTYTYNVVNMFYRYHIVKVGMAVSKLLYERNLSVSYWNFAFGAEPHDYYETMLPHTLMKVWQPYSQPTGSPSEIWINRYRANNTLTDEVGTFGKAETHQIIRSGCKVIRPESNIQSYNGYIHSIDRPLVYDEMVPSGVLNERLRIDVANMLYEIGNNFRFCTHDEVAAMNQSSNDGWQTRLPLDYFDNLICYTPKTKLSWYTQGNWRAYNSDQITGWDENDFAFRLSPVPTGDYELRIVYFIVDDGGLQQHYIGTTPNPSSMTPLGGPVDISYPDVWIEADRITSGYLFSSEYDDYGVASDLVMRTKGFMRAPAAYSRGTYNTVKQRVSSPAEFMNNINCCSRYEEGCCLIRKILGTVHIEQGKEYWLRMKNLLQGYDQLEFPVDFIEFVPLHIVNNQDFTEDWY